MMSIITLSPGHVQFASSLGLTFQAPVSYCYLEHKILLSPLDTSTAEHHSQFDLAASFFHILLLIVLWSSPVAYWENSDLRAHFLVSYLFAFPYCSWGYYGKNTVIIYISSSSGRKSLLLISLSFASPFARTRLCSIKRNYFHLISLKEIRCFSVYL